MSIFILTFVCAWWKKAKKQIHRTSSESSWNSIFPLGAWLVSNGSSIPSPAVLSSTCCCSTEYLCTKNLQAHSHPVRSLGKMVGNERTRAHRCTHLPPHTYFFTNITPAATLSSMTRMTVITTGTVLEVGVFTWKSSRNRADLEWRRQTFILIKLCVSRGTDQKFWT